MCLKTATVYLHIVINTSLKKKEIKETTPFTIVAKNIKYLGMTLTKQVKDLYDKNFKSLKKEIEEDLRRSKDLPCSRIGRIYIAKNGHLAESNLQIQCNPPSKFQLNFSYS